MVAVVGASCLVSTASGDDPNVPSSTRVQIHAPLSTVVRSIVKDGSKVKKGDLILTLDDSQIRAEIERLKIELEVAKAEILAAKASLEEAETRTEEVALAELALKVAELRRHSGLAELDLEEKVIGGQINVAKKLLALLQRRLVGKKDGNDSIDALATELEIVKVEAELEAAMAKKQLLEVMRPLREAELELDLKQTRLDLARKKPETLQAREAAKAEMKAREQVRQLKLARLKRLEDVLKQCTIHAPRDGIVHHAGPVPVSEGSQVRERQTLLILDAEEP
jgi:multidrug resistance efflux pump